MNVNLNQDDLAAEPASVTSLTAGQFVNLLGMIPYASIIANETGRIVAANRLAEELFGYAGDEFLGRPIDTLLPDRHRDRHAQHRAIYMANPQPGRWRPASTWSLYTVMGANYRLKSL